MIAARSLDAYICAILVIEELFVYTGRAPRPRRLPVMRNSVEPYTRLATYATSESSCKGSKHFKS
jgi:hypothetical protein